ncbi:MAG: Uma2 family endonuclease [Candidatus Rokubacteria bacterium]|nr:Uma2 family endonuclease [Candidatus Rokubacteria bacterium]
MDPALVERDTTAAPADDVDRWVLLTGVTWQQYEALLELFGDDQPGARMAYLEGTLEIMSPSRKHEHVKSIVGRLVEAYALDRDISLNGLGSTTFRKEAKERGVEPDECYVLGDDWEAKEFPDIAFEVIITRRGLDRLAIYEGLGVPEVWFWRRGGFEIYRLTDAGYERRDASEFLPELDFARLASFVEMRSHTKAVRAFLAELRT